MKNPKIKKPEKKLVVSEAKLLQKRAPQKRVASDKVIGRAKKI